MTAAFDMHRNETVMICEPTCCLMNGMRFFLRPIGAGPKRIQPTRFFSNDLQLFSISPWYREHNSTEQNQPKVNVLMEMCTRAGENGLAIFLLDLIKCFQLNDSFCGTCSSSANQSTMRLICESVFSVLDVNLVIWALHAMRDPLFSAVF